MGKLVDITVCGAGGRMGRRIIALAEENGLRVTGALEAPGHPALGQDAGLAAGVAASGVTIGDDLKASWTKGAVIVDFSSPAATLAQLEFAAGNGAPVVVGTTGLDPEQRARAEELAARTATVMASNMSVGITVLDSLVEQAVKALGGGFDCEILELHHRLKKDAPSGTALSLAATAAAARGLELPASLATAREGMIGERPDDEIGVVALRGGDAVGDHTVMLVGTGERLELTHRAASRDCLAGGALRAALWVAGRQPGLYGMRQVCGLEPA